MGRVHSGSAAHFFWPSAPPRAAVGRNQTTSISFLLPRAHPARDKLAPESSASTNGRPPGLRFSVLSGAGFTGVTAFHKAIKERGVEKNVDKDIYINIISYNFM
jgi:hypothetical protein